MTQPGNSDPLPGMQRVLMLVGVYRPDFDSPVHRGSIQPIVAAVIPDHVWDHEPDEDTQARWAKAKEAYDPGGFGYDWREVWVELSSAALRAPFEIPAVRGDVVEGAET